MSLWRAPKPVIAQVHGWCVGGGSDYALLRRYRDRERGRAHRRAVFAHVGRIPLGMWIYSARADQGEEHALTGKPLSGRRGGRRLG